MRLVVQRVKESNVKVDNKIVGQIHKGFLVLLGIKSTDTKKSISNLLSNPDRLIQMKENTNILARPNSTKTICDTILK